MVAEQPADPDEPDRRRQASQHAARPRPFARIQTTPIAAADREADGGELERRHGADPDGEERERRPEQDRAEADRGRAAAAHAAAARAAAARCR